jgi:hypothetical protein
MLVCHIFYLDFFQSVRGVPKHFESVFGNLIGLIVCCFYADIIGTRGDPGEFLKI